MAKKITAKVAPKEYGIKETKELLQFIFAIGKIYKEAKETEGKVDMADIGLLVKLFPQMAPAFEGVAEIPEELKSLDKDEIKELLVFSGAHLGELAGKDEKLVEQIEKGIAASLAIVEFVKVL